MGENKCVKKSMGLCTRIVPVGVNLSMARQKRPADHSSPSVARRMYPPPNRAPMVLHLSRHPPTSCSTLDPTQYHNHRPARFAIQQATLQRKRSITMCETLTQERELHTTPYYYYTHSWGHRYFGGYVPRTLKRTYSTQCNMYVRRTSRSPNPTYPLQIYSSSQERTAQPQGHNDHGSDSAPQAGGAPTNERQRLLNDRHTVPHYLAEWRTKETRYNTCLLRAPNASHATTTSSKRNANNGFSTTGSNPDAVVTQSSPEPPQRAFHPQA